MQILSANALCAEPFDRSIIPARHKKTANACSARHFDLLRKPSSTVPPYADELGLLVLATPLTSVNLSKIKFFDRLRGDTISYRLYLVNIISGSSKVRIFPSGWGKVRRKAVRPISPPLFAPYLRSPHRGQPRDANCMRIWCVLPVYKRT